MSDDLHNASAARLRSFVGRIERLDEEITGLNEDKAEVFKEAKGEGFDLPALRTLITDRRKMAKDPAKYAEQRDILAMYEAAMGSGTVRATRAPAQAPAHDPETGEIAEPAADAVPMVSLDGKGAIPLDKFMTIAKAAESPVGRGIIAGFMAATNAKAPEAASVQQPYRIDAPVAPKPPVEDLDLPAGLRREPVRSAAE